MWLLAAATALVAALVVFVTLGNSGDDDAGADPTVSPIVRPATSAPSASPSPTPTFPLDGVRYTVVDGDTLFDIAQRFGVSVESIVAANRLPDATEIAVGQVLIIPNGEIAGSPTVEATAPPADPRLTGFSFPIAGACLPTSDNLMPNAPREYRSGIHEGVDFYTGYNCVDVPAGGAVLSAKGGTVVRADLAFVEMTPAELNEILERTQAQGYTDAAALDKFRGRQVWVDHGDGIITRYCHLRAIPAGIALGVGVSAGQLVGYVGDSGTPEAVASPGVEIHLHWEVRVDDSFLGAGLPPATVRTQYERLFAGS